MPRARAFAPLAALLLAASATAQEPPVQPGKIGYSVATTSASAGSLCSGFACAPADLLVARGATLTFAVRTNPGLPFVLLAGPNAQPCVTLPGILNQWAGPSLLVFAGTANQNDTIRCWGGLATLALPVPTTTPLQTAVVTQVVADNGTAPAVPAFSQPVRITVAS
ncbi:MAG: hypothetical protein KDC87_21840 [Planctomycetes bacterium]|nr:hypothetical protein [Planctomycetota bacterium]MCB9869162.1 hypothetical protein [Planctomycetota bacterium]MCB9889003.1 hypothetical protein [Planctomycetota bacterium]